MYVANCTNGDVEYLPIGGGGGNGRWKTLPAHQLRIEKKAKVNKRISFKKGRKSRLSNKIRSKDSLIILEDKGGVLRALTYTLTRV